jgi:hypothetical protein
MKINEVPEKAIERIIKCLDMANTSTYNENEAANAMRAAKRLMEEYGLTMAELEAKKQKTTSDKVEYAFKKDSLATKSNFGTYEKILMTACQDLFSVRFVLSQWWDAATRKARTTVYILGTEGEVAISKTAYTLLRQAMHRRATVLYGIDWKRPHYHYFEGFATELCSRAREKTITKSDCKAVVIFDNKDKQLAAFTSDVFKNLKANKGRARQKMSREFFEGMTDGSKESLEFKDTVTA